MFLYTDTPMKVVTQEGGDMDPYVLEKYGENVNDPEKKSTKCRTKRGIIDYETAKKRFDEYYDNLNTTASGRMRGKMFDIKYNKKNELILYPGEPCSERYLEANGPSKYDMWGVDAFPEGTIVQVDSTHSVKTKEYGKDVPKDKRYGSTLTKKFITSNPELEPEDYINKGEVNRQFNTYFKEKEKNWEEGRPKPEKVKSSKIYESSDDEEFVEEMENKRKKRTLKKQKQEEREKKKGEKKDAVERKKEIPQPIPQSDLFYQPKYPEDVPEESYITTIEQYKELIIENIDGHFRLSSFIYIYELPIIRSKIENISEDDLEEFWKANVEDYYNKLEKPIKPMGMYSDDETYIKMFE